MALRVDAAPVSGEWVRHAPHGADLLGRAAEPTDGRWQRGDVVRGLYLADAPATAIAEWYRWLAERGLPPAHAIPHDHHIWKLDLELADLRSARRLAARGLDIPRPGRRTWEPYQQANAIRRYADAIEATCGGGNVAQFGERLALDRHDRVGERGNVPGRGRPFHEVLAQGWLDALVGGGADRVGLANVLRLWKDAAARRLPHKRAARSPEELELLTLSSRRSLLGAGCQDRDARRERGGCRRPPAVFVAAGGLSVERATRPPGACEDPQADALPETRGYGLRVLARLRSLRRRDLAAVDGFAAFVLLAGSQYEIWTGQGRDNGSSDPQLVSALLALPACLPVALRRRAPLAALAMVTVATAVTLVLIAPDHGPLEPFVALILCIYSLGAQPDRRRAIRGGAAFGLLVLAVSVPALLVDWVGSDLVPALIWMPFAWVIGRLLHDRHDRTLQLEDLAEELRAEGLSDEVCVVGVTDPAPRRTRALEHRDRRATRPQPPPPSKATSPAYSANSACSKLDLRDRIQAVVLAYESGLVQPGQNAE